MEGTAGVNGEQLIDNAKVRKIGRTLKECFYWILYLTLDFYNARFLFSVLNKVNSVNVFGSCLVVKYHNSEITTEEI